MNIKLETRRGGTLHTAAMCIEGNPPEVLIWQARVFCYLRTDGVWDHKKHVYREAIVATLEDAAEVLSATG